MGSSHYFPCLSWLQTTTWPLAILSPLYIKSFMPRHCSVTLGIGSSSSCGKVSSCVIHPWKDYTEGNNLAICSQNLLVRFRPTIFHSLCSIWPGHAGLQLFQLVHHLFISGKTYDVLFLWYCYKNLWDIILNKKQWQWLMCFTSGCNWEHSGLSWINGIYLHTLVVFSRHRQW